LTDYFSRALSATDEGQVEPVSGTDYFSRVLGTGTQGNAPVPDKALTYNPDRTLGFTQQAIGSFAPDERAWIRFAAKQLYPGEPVDAAEKRFGKSAGGRIYHKSDDGQMLEVQPPSGWGRLANVGSGVGQMLPAGAGLAAGIMSAPMMITGPLGAAASVGLTGGAAATGELGRQAIGKSLLGDETAQIDPTSAVREGLLSGLGQGIGAGFGAWASRYAAPDVAKYSSQAATSAIQKAQQQGIRLTPAEATGLDSLIQEQKRLMGVPQSANVMRDFFGQRNQEVLGSWQRTLDDVATSADAGRLGARAKDAAENVVRRAQAYRTEVATPYYQQAFAENPLVRPGAANAAVDDALQSAKGPMKSTMEKVQGLLRTPEGNASDLSLQGLDNTKKAIDQIEQQLMGKPGGLDANTRYALDNVRRQLISAMDQADGGSGAYAAGRKAYENATKSFVEPTTEAMAPLLNLRDTNLVRAGQAALDPSSRSPELVAQTRDLFRRRGHGDVWDGLVRQFMQEEAAQALKVTQAGELRNVGGKIASRFDELTMQNLRAAMEPKKFAEFRDLLDTFRATGRAIDNNSDTAFKQQAIQRAKNDAGGWISRAIRNTNPAQLVQNTADFFANKNYERQAEALAKIYTTGDPKMLNMLRSLKQTSPDDAKRIAVIGQLLTDAGYIGGDMALN